MKDPADLKKCPFCECEAELIYSNQRRQYYIICKNKHCRSSSANWSNKNRCIKKWNSRTPDKTEKSKHDWVWSNKEGMYYCNRCNYSSYLAGDVSYCSIPNDNCAISSINKTEIDRDKLYKIMKSIQAFEGDEFHELLEKIVDFYNKGELTKGK